MSDVSVKDKIEYVLKNAKKMLPFDIYMDIVSYMAGDSSSPEEEAIFEKHLESLTSKESTRSFLATYIPVALLNVLDFPSEFKCKEVTQIAFSDCVDNDDLLDSLKATGLYDRLLKERNVEVSTMSLTEYISNEKFLSDLDLLYEVGRLIDTIATGKEDEVNKPDKSEKSPLEDDAIKFYSGSINMTVSSIIKIYDDIFSSGYDVAQPFGVLTPVGCYKLNSASKSELEISDQLNAIYEIFSSKLKLAVIDERHFKSSAIRGIALSDDGENSVLDNSNLPYYPNKMLEFAFGSLPLNNCPDKKTFTKSKHAVSWNEYSEQHIVDGTFTTVLNLVLNSLRTEGYLTPSNDSDEEKMKFMSQPARLLVDKVCEQAKYGLTNCLLLSEWKTTTKKGAGGQDIVQPVGFKIRVVDTLNRLGDADTVYESIIRSAFKKSFNSDLGELFPMAIRGDYVKEFRIQFDKALCELEPLFSYKALDSLVRRGIEPSWKNLILGKADDDSIITAYSGGINFDEKLTHFIVAGSRSGKGVMTLNILASAIASQKPIFYLDRKPDMASLMKYMANKGRPDNKYHMFVVNGGMNNEADDTFKQFTPSSIGNWKRNVPRYVLDHMGSAFKDVADIFYMKAMMFVLSIINLRATYASNPEIYNALGGEDGIIAVFDELTNFIEQAPIGAKGKLGSNCSTMKYLLKQQAGGKEPISDWQLYSSHVIDKLNATFMCACEGANAGWQNTEVHRSNIFVLGQKIIDGNNVTKLKSTPVVFEHDINGGRLLASSEKNVFQAALSNCQADGFFGYNNKCANYLCANKAYPYRKGETVSNAKARLTSTARYFAYVPECSLIGLADVASATPTFANTAVYFKPFLILNDANENGTYVQQFKDNVCKSEKKYQEIKGMNLDANGKLEPRIGFEDYIKSQCKNVDIQGVLEKSYIIGNYVVEKLGYTQATGGDVIDFIYDLRPEWWFSAKDVESAFSGELTNRKRLEFYATFAPDSVDVTFEEEADKADFEDEDEAIKEAYGSNSTSIPNNSEETVPFQTDLSDSSDVKNPNSLANELDSKGESDDSLDDYFNYRKKVTQENASNPASDLDAESKKQVDGIVHGFNFGSDFSNSPEQVATELNDNEEIVENEEIEENKETEDEWLDVGNEVETPSVNPDIIGSSESHESNERVRKLEEELKRQKAESDRKDAVIAEQLAKMNLFLSYMQDKEMREDISKATQDMQNKQIEQERVMSEPFTKSFFGKKIKLQGYTGNLDIEDEIAITDDTASVSKALIIVTDHILRDISNMFGGLDRVSDLMVMSDGLVINSVIYSPVIPDNVIKKLPLDIRNDVKNGRLAWVFLFHKLRDMPNLTNLAFDSVDFVFKKVRIDLGKDKNFEPKDLFGVCPKLMNLQIEGYEMTRGTMHQYDDVFHAPRRSTQIMDNIDSWGVGATKSNWQSVKDIYKNPDKRGFWKATQVTFMTGVTATTGVATLGLRAGRKLGNLGKRLFGGVKDVKQAMSENKH